MALTANHKKDLKDILGILEDMDAEIDGDVATCPSWAPRAPAEVSLTLGSSESLRLCRRVQCDLGVLG